MIKVKDNVRPSPRWVPGWMHIGSPVIVSLVQVSEPVKPIFGDMVSVFTGQGIIMSMDLGDIRSFVHLLLLLFAYQR